MVAGMATLAPADIPPGTGGSPAVGIRRGPLPGDRRCARRVRAAKIGARSALKSKSPAAVPGHTTHSSCPGLPVRCEAPYSPANRPGCRLAPKLLAVGQSLLANFPAADAAA